MCKKDNSDHLRQIAKEHSMSVEEFKEKIGLEINQDGSHSLKGHTMDMFLKEYSDEELSNLAKKHNLSLTDMKEHIRVMKEHH